MLKPEPWGPAPLFRQNACTLVCVADIWKHTKANQISPSCRRSFVILTFLSLHGHHVIRALFMQSAPNSCNFLSMALQILLLITAIHSPAVGAGIVTRCRPQRFIWNKFPFMTTFQEMLLSLQNGKWLFPGKSLVTIIFFSIKKKSHPSISCWFKGLKKVRTSSRAQCSAAGEAHLTVEFPTSGPWGKNNRLWTCMS